MDKIAFCIDDNPSWRQACYELAEAFAAGIDIVFNEPCTHRIDISTTEDSIHMKAFEDDRLLFEKNYSAPAPAKTMPSKTFKRLIYRFLSAYFGKTLPWGCLTGIKPVKIAHQNLLDFDGNALEAADYMSVCYDVSEAKSKLAVDLAKKEMAVVYPLDEKRVSVYVGVPICPAKCHYCSFVSTVSDKKGELAAMYLSDLLAEIEAFKAFFLKKGLTVDTLYIGGGTPSVFSAEQIDTLLSALQGVFIHPGLRELTFEAGRPETTTADKLAVLRQYGVSRVCLNPQSMNDETLSAIGRHHTAADIVEKFSLMREMGFDNINMDLIAGLNGEPPEKVMRSLQSVIALAPENITMHSLAIKRGAKMRAENGHRYVQLYNDAFYGELEQTLDDAGYHPYYLYRQKYTQGNGENIGYAKDGFDGIYNILMMAERQSIIGIGAGASGKCYHAAQNRFEKVFTVKDVRTYHMRLNETIDRKIAAYSAHLSD